MCRLRFLIVLAVSILLAAWPLPVEWALQPLVPEHEPAEIVLVGTLTGDSLLPTFDCRGGCKVTLTVSFAVLDALSYGDLIAFEVPPGVCSPHRENVVHRIIAMPGDWVITADGMGLVPPLHYYQAGDNASSCHSLVSFVDVHGRAVVEEL